MAAVVLLTLAFLICKVNSQIYGSIFPGPRGINPGLNGPPTEINGPCIADTCGATPNTASFCSPSIPYNQPICNNLPTQPCIQNQIVTCPNTLPPLPQSPLTNILKQLTPSVVTNPVLQGVTTTPCVTTSVVDNTLANSLANAIQLLIVSNLIDKSLGCTSGFLDSPCINNYEVLVPELFNSAPVVTCEYPAVDYNPCVNDVPCCEESVVYKPLCVDVPPCTPNFGTSCGSSFPVLGESNSFRFDNCAQNPMIGINTCSNLFTSPSTSVIPSFGCVEPAVATIAPMAVEVPFPASIPAQLTCNFGYMPTTMPCVSVNVEPVQIDGCRNSFGNFGSGFAY